MAFRAKYEGTRCGLCDEPIHEDDLVTYVGDELCHEGCAAEEEVGRGGE